MDLKGSFSLLKKRCKLALSDSGLSWELEGAQHLDRHIPASEIVSCWLCPKGALRCSNYRSVPYPNESSTLTGICKHWGRGSKGIGFSLEVCERTGTAHRWRTRVIPILHPAADVVFTWHLAIWRMITELPERPRKLLVVINPYGGKGNARSIFKSKVAPLFYRAGIQFSTIETEHPGHATELVFNQEADCNVNLGRARDTLESSFHKVCCPSGESGLLSDVNGVVAIGGDGLVSELVKGMILSACHKSNVDPNDPHSHLPSTAIRLGIIPGGSTDATCHATHGTSDVITSVLHIIMGDRKSVDIAGLYSDGKLKGMATSIASWGYFGDLMATSEKWRCLGPTRYLLSGIWRVLCNKSYDLTLRIKKPTGSNVDQDVNSTRCNDQCVTCSKAGLRLNDLGSPPCREEWVEKNGRYQIVSATVTSCTSRLNKYGLSPSAHLGDGCSDIILVEGSSRTNLFSYLLNTCWGNAVSLNHVDIIRGKEIHFTANQFIEATHSSWSCDGELIPASSAVIKVHCQKLQLFSRGVEHGNV